MSHQAQYQQQQQQQDQLQLTAERWPLPPPPPPEASTPTSQAAGGKAPPGPGCLSLSRDAPSPNPAPPAACPAPPPPQTAPPTDPLQLVPSLPLPSLDGGSPLEAGFASVVAAECADAPIGAAEPRPPPPSLGMRHSRSASDQPAAAAGSSPCNVQHAEAPAAPRTGCAHPPAAQPDAADVGAGACYLNALHCPAGLGRSQAPPLPPVTTGLPTQHHHPPQHPALLGQQPQLQGQPGAPEQHRRCTPAHQEYLGGAPTTAGGSTSPGSAPVPGATAGHGPGSLALKPAGACFDYASMWRLVGDTLDWRPLTTASTGTGSGTGTGAGTAATAAAGCAAGLLAPTFTTVGSGASFLQGPLPSLTQSQPPPNNVITTGNSIERGPLLLGQCGSGSLAQHQATLSGAAAAAAASCNTAAMGAAGASASGTARAPYRHSLLMPQHPCSNPLWDLPRTVAAASAGDREAAGAPAGPPPDAPSLGHQPKRPLVPPNAVTTGAGPLAFAAVSPCPAAQRGGWEGAAYTPHPPKRRRLPEGGAEPLGAGAGAVAGFRSDPLADDATSSCGSRGSPGSGPQGPLQHRSSGAAPWTPFALPTAAAAPEQQTEAAEEARRGMDWEQAEEGGEEGTEEERRRDEEAGEAEEMAQPGWWHCERREAPAAWVGAQRPGSRQVGSSSGRGEDPYQQGTHVARPSQAGVGEAAHTGYRYYNTAGTDTEMDPPTSAPQAAADPAAAEWLPSRQSLQGRGPSFRSRVDCAPAPGVWPASACHTAGQPTRGSPYRHLHAAHPSAPPAPPPSAAQPQCPCAACLGLSPGPRGPPDATPESSSGPHAGWQQRLQATPWLHDQQLQPSPLPRSHPCPTGPSPRSAVPAKPQWPPHEPGAASGMQDGGGAAAVVLRSSTSWQGQQPPRPRYAAASVPVDDHPRRPPAATPPLCSCPACARPGPGPGPQASGGAGDGSGVKDRVGRKRPQPANSFGQHPGGEHVLSPSTYPASRRTLFETGGNSEDITTSTAAAAAAASAEWRQGHGGERTGEDGGLVYGEPLLPPSSSLHPPSYSVGHSAPLRDLAATADSPSMARPPTSTPGFGGSGGMSGPQPYGPCTCPACSHPAAPPRSQLRHTVSTLSSKAAAYTPYGATTPAYGPTGSSPPRASPPGGRSAPPCRCELCRGRAAPLPPPAPAATQAATESGGCSCRDCLAAKGRLPGRPSAPPPAAWDPSAPPPPPPPAPPAAPASSGAPSPLAPQPFLRTPPQHLPQQPQQPQQPNHTELPMQSHPQLSSHSEQSLHPRLSVPSSRAYASHCPNSSQGPMPHCLFSRPPPPPPVSHQHVPLHSVPSREAPGAQLLQEPPRGAASTAGHTPHQHQADARAVPPCPSAPSTHQHYRLHAHHGHCRYRAAASAHTSSLASPAAALPACGRTARYPSCHRQGTPLASPPPSQFHGPPSEAANAVHSALVPPAAVPPPTPHCAAPAAPPHASQGLPTPPPAPRCCDQPPSPYAPHPAGAGWHGFAGSPPGAQQGGGGASASRGPASQGCSGGAQGDARRSERPGWSEQGRAVSTVAYGACSCCTTSAFHAGTAGFSRSRPSPHRTNQPALGPSLPSRPSSTLLPEAPSGTAPPPPPPPPPPPVPPPHGPYYDCGPSSQPAQRPPPPTAPPPVLHSAPPAPHSLPSATTTMPETLPGGMCPPPQHDMGGAAGSLEQHSLHSSHPGGPQAPAQAPLAAVPPGRGLSSVDEEDVMWAEDPLASWRRSRG